MIMTGCTGAKRAADTDPVKPAASQTAVTKALETTTEQTTSSSAASTKETMAAVEIKITDAVDRSFTVDDESYTYKIPQVTITGVNTDAANETIRTETDKQFYDGDNKEIFDSNYEYFVSNKTVSLLISNMDLSGGEFVYIKAYNIDINTGKLISGSDVVKLSGMTDDEFFGKVKTIYTKFDNAEFKRCETKDDKNYVKQNLKKISYKYIQPYFGENGKLSFIGDVNVIGGAGVSFEKFQTA